MAPNKNDDDNDDTEGSSTLKGEGIVVNSASDLFRMFEKDGSGGIDQEEFCEIAKYMNINLSRNRILKLFSQADTDGTGTIVFDGENSTL